MIRWRRSSEASGNGEELNTEVGFVKAFPLDIKLLEKCTNFILNLVKNINWKTQVKI